METEPSLSIGDRVEVLASPASELSGHAGLCGTIYGFTTPSGTRIRFIGEADQDLAFNVGFDTGDEWFAPDLVRLLDHGVGSTMSIGKRRFVRSETGEWIEDETPT